MTLTLIVSILLAVALFELSLVYSPRFVSRLSTDTVCAALAVTTGLLLYFRFDGYTLAIGLLMVYRAINIERLTRRKLQDSYVFGLAQKASAVLIALQAALAVLAYLVSGITFSTNSLPLGLSLLGLVFAGILAHTIDHLSKRTVAQSVSTIVDTELPSLTVAIPARNETADLEACLQTLINSTYQKLEILVLDDCSQNARTPEIIRQFAHDGVRFIAGGVPPDNWLAKNFAYDQLAAQANGDVLLFCGVDARFEPDSLRLVVSAMLTKHKTMMSVLPKNIVPTGLKLEALLVQPGRYAWELVLPRRWLDRPPVLSTCWLITAKTLRDAGSMAAVSRAILPERYFARYAATHNDGYSLVQSGHQLGISSAKSFVDQRSTAVRVRYPSLHRRIELTALVSCAELVALVGPYCWLVLSLAKHNYQLAVINAATVSLLTYVYYQVVRITYQKPLARSLLLMPFAALYDVCLLNYSMWQYEYSEVIWKGRNICIPVMRVVPHLPLLTDKPGQYYHSNHRNRRGRHHGHHRSGR